MGTKKSDPPRDHIDLYHDRAYLGFADIPKDVTVTVERVERHELYDFKTKTEKDKPVLFFRGKERGLALNATNRKTMIDLFGNAPKAGWVGQTIVIHPDPNIKVAKKKVGGLRIRRAAQQQQQRAPVQEPPPPPDDVGPPPMSADETQAALDATREEHMREPGED
jgi:hypothetical protein